MGEKELTSTEHCPYATCLHNLFKSHNPSLKWTVLSSNRVKEQDFRGAVITVNKSGQEQGPGSVSLESHIYILISSHQTTFQYISTQLPWKKIWPPIVTRK